jgi:hypothetical protein
MTEKAVITCKSKEPYKRLFPVPVTALEKAPSTGAKK